LGDEVVGKGSMDMQFLVQMAHFISEDVNEDGENSAKEARLVVLVIVIHKGRFGWMCGFPLTLCRRGCDADYV
jgi:hypothetical protein